LRMQAREGAAIILTTQYLEEADALADDIVVLDHGQTVAHGTPGELKTRIGTERFDVTVASPGELERAARVLEPFGTNPPSVDRELLVATVPVREGTRLMSVTRALDNAGIDAIDVHRREATLDDVFLALTDTAREEVSA
jgi:ABC-2 type transport system ATP-binding protein